MANVHLLLSLLVFLVQSQHLMLSEANIVSRATESISSMLGSIRSSSAVQQQQQSQLSPIASQPKLVEQSQSSNLTLVEMQPQRQLAQVSQLMSNATGAKYNNVLEVISNVHKAIQQQISQAGQLQIVSASDSAPANSKKNEYQSIGQEVSQVQSLQGNSSMSYREQGELLRLEIARRAGQLQQVVASSMDLVKNNSDLIVRRLLEQLNVRLDQAKSKADKIINEPATNEVAIKALNTINLGLNNLNNIISNIVNKLELSAKENNNNKQQPNQIQKQISQLADSNKLRLNLQQISQQVSSALNAQRQRQTQNVAQLVH